MKRIGSKLLIIPIAFFKILPIVLFGGIVLLPTTWEGESTIYAQTASSKSDKPLNKWYKQDELYGVHFMVKHQQSPYELKYNTLVRLMNNNNFEVSVTFRPTFSCMDHSISKEQGVVKVNVHPRHTVTLLAYRPCNGQIPEIIQFEELKVRPR